MPLTMRSILALLFLALPALTQEATDTAVGAEPSDVPLVTVELVSTVKRIHAGESFLVGVRLILEPGYHVYWRNPGDSGGPTEARLRAPEGFKIGPAMFPAPQRMEEPGGLTTYGYENEALIFFEVTAPEKLPENRHTVFHGGARWLVCKTECVPGRGVGKMRLIHDRRKAKKKIERPQGYAALQPHLARLPRPLVTHESWKPRWMGSEDKPIFILKLPKGMTGEFFPLEDDQNRFLRARAKGGTITLHQSFLVGEQSLPRVRGLLLLNGGGKTICYELNRVWNDAPFVEPKKKTEEKGQ
ncbi:MAG: protein-disulfide reductase DsbD family protein [Planctomycetota bacterium]|jgi:thiol:disulfide interchange protein DsbD|nr:protein-disulfide reductase DsbD family protein [Planctomycetota bacterium]